MTSDSRLEILQELVREDPNDPFLQYGLAMETEKVNRTEAMNLFRALRGSHPDYLPLYYQAASLAFALSHAEECRLLIAEGIIVGKRQGDRKTVSELEALAGQVNG